VTETQIKMLRAMTDRVIIPLPGVGTLALDRDTFTTALVAGAEMAAAPAPPTASTEPLLDADQAAAQMNVSARWLEDSARARIIPHHKLGRFIRFKVSEVAAHCSVKGDRKRKLQKAARRQNRGQ
jgi:excisionase family DNA binding protein